MKLFQVLEAVASVGVVLSASMTALHAALTVLCASVTILRASLTLLGLQVFPALEAVASAGVVRKVMAALYFEPLGVRWPLQK